MPTAQRCLFTSRKACQFLVKFMDSDRFEEHLRKNLKIRIEKIEKKSEPSILKPKKGETPDGPKKR